MSLTRDNEALRVYREWRFLFTDHDREIPTETWECITRASLLSYLHCAVCECIRSSAEVYYMKVHTGRHGIRPHPCLMSNLHSCFGKSPTQFLKSTSGKMSKHKYLSSVTSATRWSFSCMDVVVSIFQSQTSQSIRSSATGLFHHVDVRILYRDIATYWTLTLDEPPQNILVSYINSLLP